MEFHKLKNYINDDTLSDWFDIINENIHSYKKDKPNSFVLNLEEKKKNYKDNFINYLRDDDFFYENLNHKDIKTKINNHEKFICYNPKLYHSKYKLYVSPDLIFHKDLFIKYFPKITIELPEYIIIDILYKNIHFNSDKTDILNKNNINYRKCKMFVAVDSLKLKTKGYLFGKEYRHKDFILDKQENIGHFPFKKEFHDLVINALDWLKNLNKNYDKWNIYPQPSVKELYPNMNHKESQWSEEKRTLAELIKEITLIWNISYKERCILLNKDIKTWDDPLLLNNIYSYKVKENGKIYIQKKMIQINLDDEIDIKPRKIKNYDFITIIKDDKDSIILDIESVINLEEKHSYFNDNELIKIPRIAIIGTIINSDDYIFKDFTIKCLSNDEEKKIIQYWVDYLIHFFGNKCIKIYHWGNAEKVYVKYMKDKYPEIKFPEFIMIDLLYYFKLEPISIKGCFGYGLKEIVKRLYDLNLIENKWEDDIDGLDAMIKIMETSELSRNMNIPLKRFTEIKNIIYYNYMDCRVLVDIIKMLKKMI